MSALVVVWARGEFELARSRGADAYGHDWPSPRTLVVTYASLYKRQKIKGAKIRILKYESPVTEVTMKVDES